MVDVSFEIDYDARKSVVTCPEKSKATLTVYKVPNGYNFFRISSDSGVVAKELAGNYTSIDAANKAIQNYFNSMKQSQGSRRVETLERISKKKASKNATETHSEASDDIHQGASD